MRVKQAADILGMTDVNIYTSSCMREFYDKEKGDFDLDAYYARQKESTELVDEVTNIIFFTKENKMNYNFSEYLVEKKLYKSKGSVASKRMPTYSRKGRKWIEKHRKYVQYFNEWAEKRDLLKAYEAWKEM